MLKTRFGKRLKALEDKLRPPAEKGMLRTLFLHSKGTALSMGALHASMTEYYAEHEGEDDVPLIINVVDTKAEPPAAAAPLPVDEEALLAAEVEALERRKAELKAGRKP